MNSDRADLAGGVPHAVATRIEQGATVEATDGRLGTVDEVIVEPETGELSYLVVRRGWSNEALLVPATLIRSVDGARDVRLSVSREEAQARAGTVPAEALFDPRARRSEIVIPVVEEQLVPEKQPVDLGELRIHKAVDSIEEAVTMAVERDDLIVERVPVNQPISEPVAVRYEGDWMVIPIMRETLVVTKQLMLAEEVRISKRTVTEDQEVRDVTRHERVTLEDATRYGVAGLNGDGAHNAPDAPTETIDPDELQGSRGVNPPLGI